MMSYIFLAVAAGAGGVAAGYRPDQLATLVWSGQALLAVVSLWGWTELSDRVRSGEVASDLLRPVPPVIAYLAGDIGRAGHAALTQAVPALLVAPLFFDVYVPRRWFTLPLFLLSTLLALVACFACRYLSNLASFWLLDGRGVQMIWVLSSGLLAGMYFPLRFLPEPVLLALWIGTPFPSLIQAPRDVLVEVDPVPVQLAIVAGQLAWVVVLLGLCQLVQHRAERKLVIQGG